MIKIGKWKHQSALDAGRQLQLWRVGCQHLETCPWKPCLSPTSFTHTSPAESATRDPEGVFRREGSPAWASGWGSERDANLAHCTPLEEKTGQIGPGLWQLDIPRFWLAGWSFGYKVKIIISVLLDWIPSTAHISDCSD